MNWVKEIAKRSIETGLRCLPLRIQVLAKQNPIHASMNYGKLQIELHSWFEYQHRRNPEAAEGTLIRWIERMPADAVFYDVGANVGNYTMIAAANQFRVVAFEPSALNYRSLIANLALNKLDRVTPFPIALSDRTGIQAFNYHKFIQGEGSNTVGMPLDYHGHPYMPEWGQEMLVYRLDDFLLEHPELPRPTHMKIDVDGIELKVLKGAQYALRTMSGVMVEIECESEKENEICSYLADQGFRRQLISRDYETCSNWFFTKIEASARG